jgi:DNA-binding MarR family transcriptional regulator
VTQPDPPTEPDPAADDRAALVGRFHDAQRRLAELLLAQRLEPLLRTTLTVPQLRALAVLQLDGETSSHRLAEVLGISPATLSGIVDRLEAAGMAVRRPDPQDGRVRLVAATERGAAAVRRIAAQEDEPLGLLDELDVADLRALTTGLEALTEVAQEAARRPEGGRPAQPGDAPGRISPHDRRGADRADGAGPT